MDERRGRCRRCAELLSDVERLERKYLHLLSKLTKAEKRIRELQEALAGRGKDSTNSSTPPSWDIVKPAKKSASVPRRGGAPVGHAPQQRPPFQADEIDAVQQHAYELCPQCGGPVELLPTPA